MSNYTFTSDILEDVLFRCSEVTTGQSDFSTQALRYINRAYQSLCDGGSDIDPTVREDWWWLRASRPGQIITSPILTPGVAIAQGATSGTFDVAPAVSVVGYRLRVSGRPEMYYINTHTAASTSFTIDAAFLATSVTSATSILVQTEYTLAPTPAMLRLISPMRLFNTTDDALNSYKIHGVDLNELEDWYPLSNFIIGIPSLFAPLTESTIRLNKVPESSIRIEYEYLALPPALTNAMNEQPIVPLNRRRLLSDIAAGFILADKDDAKAAPTLDLARRGLLAMAAENQHRWAGISDRTGRIHPRGLRRERRWRLESGGLVG